MNKNIFKTILKIMFLVIVVIIGLMSSGNSSNSYAREFIDYNNDIKFELDESYEIIRADGKFYGFQNEKFKLVYNVVNNGQITDVLPFSSFNEVTNDRIFATITNIGFNPLRTSMTLKESENFSKYVEFEGKSGEIPSIKNIYYVNDKFYIFQIIALDVMNLDIEDYKEELINIANSIFIFKENSTVEIGVEKTYYYEEKKIDNEVIENSNENLDIDNTENDNQIELENKESIVEQIEKMFEKSIKINKVGAILIVGSILALLLLRKFAVIFEYSVIKYIVGIVFGYFAYRLYENFYYSMDLEMNKVPTIIAIIIVLALVIVPKSKKKKTRKERLRDEEDTKNAENAIKSIDKI